MRMPPDNELRVGAFADILSVSEADLVAWLFGRSAARLAVRQELDLSDGAQSYFGVSTDRLATGKVGPGDVDVLFVDHDHPESSTAVECKRVKVDAHSFITHAPGKL